eukprot:2849073-Pyramimonas_sp.AAC.1
MGSYHMHDDEMCNYDTNIEGCPDEDEARQTQYKQISTTTKKTPSTQTAQSTPTNTTAQPIQLSRRREDRRRRR